jgi:integrase
MAPVPGRDTTTKYQGVFARHQQACATTASGDPKVCNCTPSYYGVAWDRAAGRHRKTRRFPRAGEARNAREDLLTSLREGKLPASTAGPRFDEVRDKFIEAARSGVALNKWGRRYRRRAWEDLESALRQVPEPIARRRLGDVRRGDVQRLVDELSATGLSGSRVRSVVNALRSLYRWAQDRELVSHDPAALVRLPAMDATPRERVATPDEFADLLTKLPVEDAVPYALAGYATARHQEIRVLDWQHVDLQLAALELAADEEGRKPGGSWRVVPLVKPALTLLKRAWIAQGRPRGGKVCPPRYAWRSGLLALSHLQHRVHKQWAELGLEPIGLHEARHTAATWLDHAGVSPKVASQLMGHKTPDYQAGAAPITLRRYTHTLPGELERARDQLDRFLAERAQEKASQR